MKIDQTQRQRRTHALLAGALALMLLLGLSWFLSHTRVLAQPMAETTALSVTKDVNKSQAAPGDVLTYTITINSDGEAAWMTDTLPNELTYVADSLAKWGPGDTGYANGVITWTSQNLGFGYVAVVTFSAQISPELTYGDVVNTAQVTGSGALVEDSAQTLAVVEVGNLDNGLTEKMVDPEQIEPGDTLTYTIQIYNESTEHAVPGTWITDELPSGLSYLPGTLEVVPDKGSYGFAGDVLTWTHDVAPGDFIRLIFQAQMAADFPNVDSFTNTAEFVVPGQTFTRTVSAERVTGLLQATKSVYPSRARPGELLTYTVHLANHGDGTLGVLWMTDDLPSQVNLITDSLAASRGEWGVAGDVITWTTGDQLLPQEAVSITFAAQIVEDTSGNVLFTNTAQIAGAGSLAFASALAEARTSFDYFFPVFMVDYPPVPDLNPIPAPVNRAYTVSWEPITGLPVDQYVLQQSRDSEFGSVENSWTKNTTSQDVTNAYCAYYYRVRADNASKWGVGRWSEVEAAQASPPVLTLNEIPDPDSNNAYIVSWSPASIGVDGYLLQESKSASFASVTREWETTSTSLKVEGGSSGGGTFYYRVRAVDDDCWGDEAWSNVESVVVQIRYDFNANCPSWAVREHTGYDGPEGTDWFNTGCGGGKLEIWVNDRWEHVIASPLVRSPDRPYEIQTSIFFQDRAWSSGYALVFGILEPEVVRYYRINVVYLSDGHMKFQVKRCEADHCSEGTVLSEGVPGADSAGYIQVDKSILNGQEWNRWRVRRTDNHIQIYANDELLLDITDSFYSGVGYFGLMVSTWEFKPASILVDYYNVVPLQ